MSRGSEGDDVMFDDEALSGVSLDIMEYMIFCDVTWRYMFCSSWIYWTVATWFTLKRFFQDRTYKLTFR